jgi:hypothetical protein
MLQSNLAIWAQKEFNLLKLPGQSTISDILKRKNQFTDMSQGELQLKRRRTVQHPQLDEALANWVLQCEHNGVRLTGHLICIKAKKFATDLEISEDLPNFSQVWLEKFQQRHGFRSIQAHGESGSADNAAIELALPQILKTTDKYALRDIFNMDETGLFYCMSPDRTIASQQIEGAKKDKIRLTVALTCNADGSEKPMLFFLGHANKPRCFQKKSGEDLGFFYRSNKKAWMTGLLFQVRFSWFG